MKILIDPVDIKAGDPDLGRIIGGMSWPADKPGYAVVLGEERLPRKGGRQHHVRVLAETTHGDKQLFLSEIGELQAMYRTQGWYGRGADEGNLVHLYIYNGDAVKRGLRAIEFYAAPYSRDGRVELYADMSIKLLQPASKYLHLGAADIAKYLSIPPDERTTATANTHPAVAALGYALAVFELYPAAEEDGGKKVEEEEDVDPLTGY